MDIANILARYRTDAVKTAGVEKVETAVESAVKTAHENGAREADNMMKVAAAMGDVIGNRIADIVSSRIAESFGYDPEVTKTASLQEIMYDAMLSVAEQVKVAEQVTGNTFNGAVSTQKAEEVQIQELAAHHANLAAQSASDAVQSLQQGDEHTAAQAMNTAANAIEVAKQLAGRIPANAAVANHVNEASSIVSEAANMAAAHAQA
jgi:hypothetical protein